MNSLQKAELAASAAIFRDYQNLKYRFTVPKFRMQLAEKREEEEEEEHRQLQNIIQFMQTQ